MTADTPDAPERVDDELVEWMRTAALTADALLREKRRAEAAEARAAEAERLREALERIVQWAAAYPVEIFPEVDSQWLSEAAEALKRDGKTLDRLSASNMRHVLAGVGEIARAALAKEPTHD